MTVDTGADALGTSGDALPGDVGRFGDSCLLDFFLLDLFLLDLFLLWLLLFGLFGRLFLGLGSLFLGLDSLLFDFLFNILFFNEEVLIRLDRRGQVRKRVLLALNFKGHKALPSGDIDLLRRLAIVSLRWSLDRVSHNVGSSFFQGGINLCHEVVVVVKLG